MSSSYSVYSSDFDPGCQLCQSGQHQIHSTQMNQVAYQSPQITQAQYLSQAQFQNKSNQYSATRVVSNPQIQTQFIQNQQLSPKYTTNQQYTTSRMIQAPQTIVSPSIVVTPPKQVTYTNLQPQYRQVNTIQQVEQRPIIQQQSVQQIQQRNTFAQSIPYSTTQTLPISTTQTIPYAQSQVIANSQTQTVPYSLSYNQTNQSELASTSRTQQLTHIHNVEHLPLVHEIHHIERPVQVVGIEEVEQPFRVKVMVLEKQLIELELLIKKGGNRQPQVQSVVVEDTNKIRKLQVQIEELERLIRDTENMIMDAQGEFERLQIEFENSSSSEEITYMTSELETWKKKFIDLNRKFHSCQEEMMLKQAELDSLRNKKTVVVRQDISSSNIRNSNFSPTNRTQNVRESNNYQKR